MACQSGSLPHTYSAPIDINMAKDEINAFRNMKTIIRNLANSLTSGSPDPNVQNAKTFLLNIANNNVFVFDRDLIERFVTAPNANEIDLYGAFLGHNVSGSYLGATLVFGAFKKSIVGSAIHLTTIKPSGDEDCALTEHPQRLDVADVHGILKDDNLEIILDSK